MIVVAGVVSIAVVVNHFDLKSGPMTTTNALNLQAIYIKPYTRLIPMGIAIIIGMIYLRARVYKKVRLN